MADPKKTSEGPAEETLPHVDFTTFVLSLSHSALMHLGEAPGETGEIELNLPSHGRRSTSSACWRRRPRAT